MNQIIGIQLVLVVWMPWPAPGGGQQESPPGGTQSLWTWPWDHPVMFSAASESVVIKVLIVLSYNDRRALHWQSMLEITDHQLSCS